jgi:hypothetical protein
MEKCYVHNGTGASKSMVATCYAMERVKKLALEDIRMLFANRMRNACCLSAIVLACGMAAPHADPVGCEQNNVTVARVVASEARVNFIAGRSERTPACPSAERRCRLRAYLVPGDEVLVDTADGPYVCTFFKSKGGTETRGWLPRAAVQIARPEPAPLRQWDGKWRRDREAQIVIKSSQDGLEVSGDAMWGSRDPQRVKRGGVHVGELSGKGKPRGQTLALGWDPDRSTFSRLKDEPPADCAAKLDLYGRYLLVEDNRGCGGSNVSFTGIYVRVASPRRSGQ